MTAKTRWLQVCWTGLLTGGLALAVAGCDTVPPPPETSQTTTANRIAPEKTNVNRAKVPPQKQIAPVLNAPKPAAQALKKRRKKTDRGQGAIGLGTPGTLGFGVVDRGLNQEPGDLPANTAEEAPEKPFDATLEAVMIDE